MKNRVCYHLWYLRGKGTKADQLIKQLYLPLKLRDNVLRSYHDSVIGSHQHTEQTFHKIRLKYFWPNQYNDVEYYCQSCLECQQGKPYTHGRKAPLNPIPPEDTFFNVHMDIIELPASKEGYKYVLLLIDQFSKWPEAFPMKKMTAKDVARIRFTRLFVIMEHSIASYLTGQRTLCQKLSLNYVTSSK